MDFIVIHVDFVVVHMERALSHWERAAVERFCKSMLTFGGVRCFMLAMSDANKVLLGDLLKATSRSFYLTLRVLPAAVRPQIGLVKGHTLLSKRLGAVCLATSRQWA
jgi:hypothetical protein